ncbi:phosphodiester glycosidase family protein [Streptomyces sp. NPDC000410]|uniref:phosphodiester glycosidase family protein n=1 Tax=Streptomyces sp. NPDC000410 TaxID=3154254 RepID=UPI00331EEB72
MSSSPYSPSLTPAAGKRTAKAPADTHGTTYPPPPKSRNSGCPQHRHPPTANRCHHTTHSHRGRRLPQTSIGVAVHQAAALMKWLGAKDALSLGSGGDTTLLINGTLYNRPMDNWRAPARVERPAGNAVVVVPRCRSLRAGRRTGPEQRPQRSDGRPGGPPHKVARSSIVR